MPWMLTSWSENVKKLSCRYVLQRYLGQFLEEKLTLDQLSVDLYNGVGSVSDVTLDVQALNELGEQHNLPVEFVDGFISEIKVSVPWTSLLTDSSSLEVNGLNLVIQPKQRPDNATPLFESMWSSMTSSMQFAEECLRQNERLNTVNGVEEFAKTIDSVLARVRIKFLNTNIRLEHLPKDTSKGAAIEMQIKQFTYFDEISTESFDEKAVKPASAYSIKVFTLEGAEFYSNEFYASHRTISRSLLIESSLSDENSENLERRKVNHDLILFGKLIGKQELKLKVKIKDNVSGPKLDVELNMSSLIIYVSPRQLHTICEVICGLMSPHLQDTSNVISKIRLNQKPMTSSDFERVEQELNQQVSPTNLNQFVSKSLQNTAGWSSGGVEEESDDDFQPVKGHISSLTCSTANSFSSSCNSSVNSYHISSKGVYQNGPLQSRYHPSKHKDKGASSEPDFIGDFSSFQLRLNSLAVILLHQDVLHSSDITFLSDDTSIDKMQTLSRQFFAQFMSMSTGYHGSRNDFTHGRQILQNAIERNHFRLYCSTVVVNGEEKSNSNQSEIHGALTIATAEVVECLKELENGKSETVELIRFIRDNSNDTQDTGVYLQPDVEIYFKIFKNFKHFSDPNFTKLTVNLQHCCTEIDVTMIDRLTHIIDNLNALSKSFGKTLNHNKIAFSDAHTPVVDYKFEWKVMLPSAFVKFRFPIPNLSNDDMDTTSFWYKRNIHNDILFAELTEVSIRSLTSTQQLDTNLELQCKSVRISFQESKCDKSIPFLFSGVDENFGMSLPNEGRGFGWPRLVLHLYPKINYFELEEEEEQIDLTRSSHMFQSMMRKSKKPSPFAAKMVYRESNTSHPKNNESNDENEEIILPGSKEEIEEFIEDACCNALIQLNITLPALLIQIPSKHFYEVIYNRINNDLMLWVPRSSKQSFDGRDSSYQNQNYNFSSKNSNPMFTSFSLCKSSHKKNSDSDDEEACENLLINMDPISECKKKQVTSQQQSKVAVSLFVAQGVLDIFPHARDLSGKVIPEQFGEIQLLFNEADLFYVSSYKADPLLNYICLRINHISLYHCSLISGSVDVGLKPVDSYPSRHVLPIIYKTREGGLVSENAGPVGAGTANSEDMLTLAVRVQGQENRYKNICVANSLNCVTIRHRIKAAYTSWLSQLIDFFDVMDYPILHYQPWKIVTQLHQQFVNCLIDYRPLHLPLKAALTVEYFNISSNITTKTSTSILRLIAEEGSLFISKKVKEPYDNPDDLSIDLKEDYVCVVDMGLFELSLRLTDSGDGPQTDLRASNNIVHIRTCADSAVALMDLIKYIASDGDLRDTNESEVPAESYNTKDMRKPDDDILVNLKQNCTDENVCKTSTSSENSSAVLEEDVPYLVEEAINDTTIIKPTKKTRPSISNRENDNVELFYFREEKITSNNPFINPVFSDSISSDDDLDNEFIILDAEVGVGYLGKSNIPEVRLLTREPIRMVDNHFSVPISKVDVLKAPKGYPNPVSKYTLREMTIVWHMYGGHDFSKENDENEEKKKKHVNIISDDLRSSQESLSYRFDDSRATRKASFDSINVAYSAVKSPELVAVNFVVPRSASRLSFCEAQNDSPTVLYDRQKSNTWQARGGPNRNHDALMELKLTKLKYQYEIYPNNTKQACRQILLVQEVEILDRMETSKIHTFLYQYSSSARPKQSNANMVVIKATNIRPEPNLNQLQECCLRVSLLPLRLNIDQDSLLFLIHFFSEISGSSKVDNKSVIIPKPTPQPVMNIENLSPSESASLTIHSDDNQVLSSPNSTSTPIFIRSFVFSPEVPIRLDYEGKRVDLTHGSIAGLIMGLGQLNCSELKLKRLYHRQGFLGLEKLISFVLSEWLQDIKKNQLPSILGGIGPIYSLVQLFQGIRDLFWLPIEQYQRDGRIVRGLQRGANSFTTSSAVAVLEITARLVYAIQRIAETAFDIVSPGPSIKYLRYYNRNDKNRTDRRISRPFKCQPAGIREGFESAFQIFKDGLGETAETLVRVASIEQEVKGAIGVVGGVLKELPPTAIKPIILASQATVNVLDGAKSQLDPDARTEATLKWRTNYF